VKQTLRQCIGKIDAAAIVALAGTVLLVARWAAARPLWLDEEMIALNVRGRGFLGLPGALWLGQSAPLGWLVLERLALVVFGAGERSLRLLPVLFGIAAPWTAVWIGRRWMRPAGAATFVFLITFSIWLTFHDLELKPYSGDVWFGLLLPALAAGAIDEASDRRFVALVRRWWGVAAIAQWCSNGALLVTPTTAAIVAGESARRRGWRGLWDNVAPGAAWVFMFGTHYALATRFAVHSAYLRSYWSVALPPHDAGVLERLRWLAERFIPFAEKPGSTALPLVFWVAAACGLLLGLRVRRGLALAFLPVPIAGFAFAGIGQVPLWERLSLWMVPALDVGIAVLVDACVQRLQAGARRRRWPGVATAAAGLALAVAALTGVVRSTWRERDLLRIGGSNHALDDRDAIAWLMARHRPGDVLITTRLAEPAVWWYADTPIDDSSRGRIQHDGSPILEAMLTPSQGAACDEAGLRALLRGRPRALVYLGFRFDDQPPEFDDVLLRRLTAFGTMTGYREFAERGRVAIFDLTVPSRSPFASPLPDAPPEDPRTPLAFCLRLVPAERW
jgi:hypothetical protein